jgi:outer membrane protein assembly factor BamB
MKRCLLLSCLLVVGVAADWTRFRGPNGSGVSDDKSVPVTFDEADVRWRLPVPGRGNSSPCVVGGKVFLQTASENGSDRALLCVDAHSGKQLWSKPMTGQTARMHQKNSLASSTPASDGERVYALFWDGAELTLTGFDFEGALLWKTPLGPFQARHGAGASPMVVGKNVVVYNVQDGSALLSAYDGLSGKQVWQTPRKSFKESSYGTPFLRDTAEGPELVVASSMGISGHDPATGAERWNWDWVYKSGPLRLVASPIAGSGLVFATTGNGGGNSHAVAVRPGGNGMTASLVWEKTKGWPYVPMLLEHAGHLYTVNDRGIAGCYEAATGQELWTARLGTDAFTSSPLLIDGKVYAISEKGTVYVFAADPSRYRSLAKNTLNEEVYASPAVADGRLYVRGREHLICVGKK